MRVAHSYTDLPAPDVRARPRPLLTTFRLVGLLVAISVPTAFWVFALQLGSKAVGIAISTPALTVCGLVIAAICFVGAAVVMAGRD